MTVSGGDWTNGETVKNTVARYPSITPTSDEVVTKFDECTAGATTYMVGSNTGTNEQLDDLRKTLSSATQWLSFPTVMLRQPGCWRSNGL